MSGLILEGYGAIELDLGLFELKGTVLVLIVL